MPAGLNVRARIWRFTTDSDDEVGGALQTGTVQQECVHARFNMERPSRLLRQQGVEVQSTATAAVRYTKDLIILEGDEFEIIGPTYHPQYGEHWLINGVTYPNMHPADRRGMVELSMRR